MSLLFLLFSADFIYVIMIICAIFMFLRLRQKQHIVLELDFRHVLVIVAMLGQAHL